LPARILPGERLQRQVDADGLAQLHQRRSRLGVAEAQELGRPRAHPDRNGTGGVVDAGEGGDAHGLELHGEPVDGRGPSGGSVA
jgi:hypothetical protein